MNYKENIIVGIEGLRSHKLRSFLSILGIIFGVGAVISMLSIGEGAKQEALDQIKLMGINNIIVYDEPVKDENETEKQPNQSQGLTWADARAMCEINPLVEVTVPVRELSLNVLHKHEYVKASIIGTTPDYISVMNYVPLQGSFFNYSDVEQEQRVCVLGSGIKWNLFYFRDPVGEEIKIGNQWFTIIGVMEDKTVSGSQKSKLEYRDVNQDIYIPITAALKRFTQKSNESEINMFIAYIRDVSRIREAANIISNSMNRRHNKVKDYTITVPEALLRQSQRTQRIFNIVMGAIAGISLLVGGIGIMNIMLATVLERTREIGIRRAVGATQRDILFQFLVEAVMLSFSGGIVGVILGFILTKIIAMYAHWKTIVSWESVLLAFCVSVAVGIIFGVYPAKKAAQENPIVALRYE